VALPACEVALGSARIDVADSSATEALELPVAMHLAALSPLGAGRLTCAAEPVQAGAERTVALTGGRA
jgi:hypothetical protein